MPTAKAESESYTAPDDVDTSVRALRGLSDEATLGSDSTEVEMKIMSSISYIHILVEGAWGITKNKYSQPGMSGPAGKSPSAWTPATQTSSRDTLGLLYKHNINVPNIEVPDLFPTVFFRVHQDHLIITVALPPSIYTVCTVTDIIKTFLGLDLWMCRQRLILSLTPAFVFVIIWVWFALDDDLPCFLDLRTGGNKAAGARIISTRCPDKLRSAEPRFLCRFGCELDIGAALRIRVGSTRVR